MKELTVQAFLRSFISAEVALEAIQTEPHSIKVNRVGDLAVLNYGICESSSDLTDDCRALILHVPSFDVVSFSFRRFYNYGEGRAADIDWPTASVQEKVDGTLIVFYHNGERWDMQTRKMIGATGEVPAGRFMFRDRVLALLGGEAIAIGELLDGVPHDWCVVCEYVGPYNRIVTQYDTEDLYLLAVTDRANLCGVPEPRMNWPFSIPKTYPLNGGLDELVQMASELPTLAEGYVVVDGNDRRIKVKNPAYLAIARTINAGALCTDKHFAGMALAGDTSEIKSYFPELAGRIELAETALASAKTEALAAWAKHGTESDRKTFALAVKSMALSAWLFNMKDGRDVSDVDKWARDNVLPEKLASWM